MTITRRQVFAASTAVALRHARRDIVTARAYHVLGVPLRTGSLYPGNENDAQAYRDVRFVQTIREAGWNAIDEGDLAIPNYLPHHAIAPIRSWPGAKIVWDCLSDRITPYLAQPGHVPFLIGCDCSIVIGSAQALYRSGAKDIHVLYVDGDFDDAAPEAERSQSAASLAVWLLTNRSPFWSGPALHPSEVTVIGWSNPSKSGQAGVGSVSLADVRRAGSGEAARRVLATIPPSANLLLHLDIDVLRKQDMAAAYFPHDDGLNLSEATELIGTFFEDPRIRIIEISEYAALRDLDRRYAGTLTALLSQAITNSQIPGRVA